MEELYAPQAETQDKELHTSPLPQFPAVFIFARDSLQHRRTRLFGQIEQTLSTIQESGSPSNERQWESFHP